MMKFRLFLFKFLGKFIKYYKRKYMALHRESIIVAINASVGQYLSNYEFINRFRLGEGMLTMSNMGLQSVTYNVVYNNTFVFDIKVKYEDGLVKRTLSLPEADYDISEISDFYNYFRADSTDLSEMLIELNKLV